MAPFPGHVKMAFSQEADSGWQLTGRCPTKDLCANAYQRQAERKTKSEQHEGKPVRLLIVSDKVSVNATSKFKRFMTSRTGGMRLDGTNCRLVPAPHS